MAVANENNAFTIKNIEFTVTRKNGFYINRCIFLFDYSSSKA